MGDFLKLQIFDTPRLFAKLTWCQYCQLFRSQVRVKLVKIAQSDDAKERSLEVFDFAEDEEIHAFKKFKRILRNNDPRVTIVLAKCNSNPKATDSSIDNSLSIETHSFNRTRDCMPTTPITGKRRRGRPRLDSPPNIPATDTTIEQVISDTTKATQDSPVVTKPEARTCGSQTPLHFNDDPNPPKMIRKSLSGRETRRRFSDDSPPVLYREDDGGSSSGEEWRQTSVKKKKKRKRREKVDATENPYKKIFPQSLKNQSSRGERIRGSASAQKPDVDAPSTKDSNKSKQCGSEDSKKRSSSSLKVVDKSQDKRKRPNESVSSKRSSGHEVQSLTQQSSGNEELTPSPAVVKQIKLSDSDDITLKKKSEVAARSAASPGRNNLSKTSVPSEILKSPSHSSNSHTLTPTKTSDKNKSRLSHSSSAHTSPEKTGKTKSSEVKHKHSTNDIPKKEQSSTKNLHKKEESNSTDAKTGQLRKELSNHTSKTNEKPVDQKTSSRQPPKLPKSDRTKSGTAKKREITTFTEVLSQLDASQGLSSKKSQREKTAPNLKLSESGRRENIPTKNTPKTGEKTNAIKDLGKGGSSDVLQGGDDTDDISGEEWIARVQRFVETGHEDEAQDTHPQASVSGKDEKSRSKHQESKVQRTEKSEKKVSLPPTDSSPAKATQKTRDSVKKVVSLPLTEAALNKPVHTAPKIVYTLKKRDDEHSRSKKTELKTHLSKAPESQQREQSKATSSVAKTTESSPHKESKLTDVDPLLAPTNAKISEATASQVGVAAVDAGSTSSQVTETHQDSEANSHKTLPNAQVVHLSLLTVEALKAVASFNFPIPAKSNTSDAHVDKVDKASTGPEVTCAPLALKAKEFQDIVKQYAATITSLFASGQNSAVANTTDPDRATKQNAEVIHGCNTAAPTSPEVASDQVSSEVNAESVSTSTGVAEIVDKSYSASSETTNDYIKPGLASSKTSEVVRKPVLSESKTTKEVSKTVSSESKTTEVVTKLGPASSKTPKVVHKAEPSESTTIKEVIKPVSSASATTEVVAKSVSSLSKITKDLNKPGPASAKTSKVVRKREHSESKSTYVAAEPDPALSTTKDGGKPVSTASKTTRNVGKPVSKLSKITKDVVKPDDASSKITEFVRKAFASESKRTENAAKPVSVKTYTAKNVRKKVLATSETTEVVKKSVRAGSKLSDVISKLHSATSQSIKAVGEPNSNTSKITEVVCQPVLEQSEIIEGLCLPFSEESEIIEDVCQPVSAALEITEVDAIPVSAGSTPTEVVSKPVSEDKLVPANSIIVLGAIIHQDANDSPQDHHRLCDPVKSLHRTGAEPKQPSSIIVAKPHLDVEDLSELESILTNGTGVSAIESVIAARKQISPFVEVDDIAYAASQEGDIAYAASQEGDIAYAGSQEGDIAYAASQEGDIAYATSQEGDIAYAASQEGDIAYAASQEGDIAYAESQEGDIAYAASQEGDIAYATSQGGDIAYATSQEGDIAYAASQEGDIAYAASQEGDIAYAGSREDGYDTNSRWSLDGDDECINLDSDEEDVPANFRDVEEDCFEVPCPTAEGVVASCNYVPDPVDLLLDVTTTSGLQTAKISVPDAFITLSNDSSKSASNDLISNNSKVTKMGWNTNVDTGTVVPKSALDQTSNAVDNEDTDVQFLTCKTFEKKADDILVVDLTDSPDIINDCDSESVEPCSSVSVTVQIKSDDRKSETVVAPGSPERTVNSFAVAVTNDSLGHSERVEMAIETGGERKDHRPDENFDNSFLDIVEEPIRLSPQLEEETAASVQKILEAEEEQDLDNSDLESTIESLSVFGRPQRCRSSPPENFIRLEQGGIFRKTMQPLLQEEVSGNQPIPEEDGVKKELSSRLANEEGQGLAKELVPEDDEIIGDTVNLELFLTNLRELQTDPENVDDTDTDIKILAPCKWSQRFDAEIVSIAKAEIQLLMKFPRCVDVSFMSAPSKTIQETTEGSSGPVPNQADEGYPSKDKDPLKNNTLQSTSGAANPSSSTETSEKGQSNGNVNTDIRHLSGDVLKSFFELEDIVNNCSKDWEKIFRSNHYHEQYDNNVLKYREKIDSLKLTIAAKTQKLLLHMGHNRFHNMLFISLRTQLTDQRPLSMFIPYTVYYHFFDAMVLFIATPRIAHEDEEPFLKGLISVYNECVTLFNKSEAELVTLKRTVKENLNESRIKRRKESLKLKQMLLNASLLESKRQVAQQPETQRDAVSLSVSPSQHPSLMTHAIAQQPNEVAAASVIPEVQSQSSATNIPESIPSPPPMQMFEIVGNRIVYTARISSSQAVQTTNVPESSLPKVPEPRQQSQIQLAKPNPVISLIKVHQQPVNAPVSNETSNLIPEKVVNQESSKQDQRANHVLIDETHKRDKQSENEYENRPPERIPFTQEQSNGQQVSPEMCDRPKEQLGQHSVEALPRPFLHTPHREVQQTSTSIGYQRAVVPPLSQHIQMQSLAGVATMTQQSSSSSIRLQQEHFNSSDRNDRQDNQLTAFDFDNQHQIFACARNQEFFFPPSDKRAFIESRSRETHEPVTVLEPQQYHQQPADPRSQIVPSQSQLVSQPIDLSVQLCLSENRTTRNMNGDSQPALNLSNQQATLQRSLTAQNPLSTPSSVQTYAEMIATRLRMIQDANPPQKRQRPDGDFREAEIPLPKDSIGLGQSPRCDESLLMDEQATTKRKPGRPAKPKAQARKRAPPKEPRPQTRQAKKAKQQSQHEATDPEDAYLPRFPNTNALTSPGHQQYHLSHQHSPANAYAANTIPRGFYENQGINFSAARSLQQMPQDNIPRVTKTWHVPSQQQQQNYFPGGNVQEDTLQQPDPEGQLNKQRQRLLFGEVARRSLPNEQHQTVWKHVPAGTVAIEEPRGAANANLSPFWYASHAQPNYNESAYFHRVFCDSTSDITGTHSNQNASNEQADDEITMQDQVHLPPGRNGATNDPKRNVNEESLYRYVTDQQQDNSNANQRPSPDEEPQVSANQVEEPALYSTAPFTNSPSVEELTKTTSTPPTMSDNAFQAGEVSKKPLKAQQKRMDLRTSSVDSGFGQHSPGTTPEILRHNRSGYIRMSSGSNVSSMGTADTLRYAYHTGTSFQQADFEKANLECRVCHRDASRICGGCHHAHYCGRKCQVNHETQ